MDLLMELFCDDKAEIQIAANLIYHERTKHIKINCHIIRENVLEGLIHTVHVPSTLHLADILTKGLGKSHHGYFLSKPGVLIASQHTA